MGTDMMHESNGKLSIFVTDQDKQSTDIAKMSDFISNRIRNLATSIIQEHQHVFQKVSLPEFAAINNLLCSNGAIMQGDYEYVLDFDSLPADVLDKYKRGLYKLGESRQVDGNLRAVIVDETGTRVKDITIKQAPKAVCSTQQLQQMHNLAIQLQLKQINRKLDVLVEMQDYHIDFSRNNAIIVPFFNARDKIVHAQNEFDIEKQRQYLDDAVSELEKAINAIYVDIRTVKARFLRHTYLPFGRIQWLVDRYIGFISQDLQMLLLCNSILYQIFEFMGKKKDKMNAYNKYRKYILEFYTKAIGKKQLPLSLQIHNAFSGYTPHTMDSWKSMTDEMVPILQQNTPIIEGMYIISMEDVSDEEE
jgi:hypothetical protein